MITSLQIQANSYCYKDEDTYVFLDRKDARIKTFSSYDECVKYAEKNIEKIDR